SPTIPVRTPNIQALPAGIPPPLPCSAAGVFVSAMTNPPCFRTAVWWSRETIPRPYPGLFRARRFAPAGARTNATGAGATKCGSLITGGPRGGQEDFEHPGLALTLGVDACYQFDEGAEKNATSRKSRVPRSKRRAEQQHPRAGGRAGKGYGT